MSRAFCLAVVVLIFSIWSTFSFVVSSRTTSTAFYTNTNNNKNNKIMTLQASKVGFIGCGTIAAAIATGLATTEGRDGEPPLVSSMALSRRSKAKSAALAERFPDLVTVHDDNQEILDKADIIFITVLPDQASTVLQSLKFDPERHNLVSLVVSTCRR